MLVNAMSLSELSKLTVPVVPAVTVEVNVTVPP